MKYALELKDRTDFDRIVEILDHHCTIMELQNEDSKESISGGAGVYYVVEIKLKEMWG